MEPIFLPRQRFLAGDVFIGVVVVAALYLGRPVLVPIAMAVLLSFVLTPLVVRLRHLGVPEFPSVVAVVLFACIVVASVAGVIGLQLTQLAGELPRYQYTLEQKAASIRDAASGSTLAQGIGEFLRRINTEISRTGPAAQPPVAAQAPAAPEPAPVPVIVTQPAPKPIDMIQSIVGPMVEPLLTMGIVVVFVVFILLQRRDLRDRLIWVTGARDLRRATLAIDDAAERLSRYFSTQTAINATFGVVVAAGLWLIGIPNPVLWGVLALLLRFVPYVGTFIAIALPLALAAAVDPGWSKVIWTIGLFAVLELLVSQAVEPLLYGRSTGLSPVSVVVAATFWTWLWGPVGLVVSTPLTLLIVVVGQHVERLSFLAVLFGDAPALTPAESFFQRVMTGDADETAEQGLRYLKHQTLAEYYDEVALPALRMAQIEANDGMIDHDGLQAIAETVAEIVENFDDHEDAQDPPMAGVEKLEPRPAVLCIAGRSPLDAAAANMLRQLLEKKDFDVNLASFSEFSAARILSREMAGVRFICLSYLAAPNLPSHSKFLIRRLRRRVPDATILAGYWTFQSETALDDVAREIGADEIATSLRSAVEICLSESRRSSAANAPDEQKLSVTV